MTPSQVLRRYRTPDRTGTADGSAWTPSLDLGLTAPATMLASAVAMVGLTHPYIGQLAVDLHRVSASVNTTFGLRSTDLLDASDNNFTSVDLLNLAGMSREDFGPSGTWALHALDTFRFDAGQIEYVQLQVTVRTLPNRADTDGDGLNDSEELNLGSDGFATDPWKADTDGDTVEDSLEYAGWSRSGSTIVANLNGFHSGP